ncbi:MAG: hypothetical protein JOZ65_04425 [Chloroflexi bacterium]|nr:hypothetical protein [Chloroflexota bacterium]
MHVLNKSTIALLLMLASTGSVQTGFAQACTADVTGCTASASIRAKVAPYDVQAAVYDLGGHGFQTSLGASLQQTSAGSPSQGAARRPRSGDTEQIIPQGYCWHDDHAFLPSGARAGIPCGSSTTAGNVDPGAIARSMFDHLDLPDLRIDMNPRLGMVNVPTWFWVDGYGGDVIPLTDNLVLTHEECHAAVDRGAGGLAVLDANGAPSTHQECRTVSDTLTVQVRAWPRSIHWSFGDNHDQMVSCPDLAACSSGVGRPYTDPQSPSPIAHSYHWSSLGANGSADVYSIGLVIKFGAQYRFSIDGRSGSGWQGLADRDLSWTAVHRVQEAQAVLVKACPVSVVSC